MLSPVLPDIQHQNCSLTSRCSLVLQSKAPPLFLMGALLLCKGSCQVIRSPTDRTKSLSHKSLWKCYVIPLLISPAFARVFTACLVSIYKGVYCLSHKLSQECLLLISQVFASVFINLKNIHAFLFRFFFSVGWGTFLLFLLFFVWFV